MASLYISEFSSIAISELGHQVAAPATPPIQEQKVTITGTSASVQFNSKTRFVMVHTDGICSLAFGIASATATTSNGRVAANETRFYGVVPNSFIAVITNT